MDYDELVQKLRDWSDTHSFSAVPRAAADAITKLRAERDNWAALCAATGEDLRAAKADLAAALQPPRPIIMPAQDWELNQEVQRLNERLAYLEPIFIAARDLVDNAEEYECDGLGLFAQHGWWEPLHDALDPDGSEAADDIRKSVAPAK